MGISKAGTAGKTLKVGLSTDYKAVVAGVEMQSGSQSTTGELKVYRDKDGTAISLYALDENDEEWQGEALMKSTGYTAMKVGDVFTATGLTGTWLVKSCEEVYSNEDVTKVRFTIHKYADLTTTQGTGGTGTGG